MASCSPISCTYYLELLSELRPSHHQDARLLSPAENPIFGPGPTHRTLTPCDNPVLRRRYPSVVAHVMESTCDIYPASCVEFAIVHPAHITSCPFAIGFFGCSCFAPFALVRHCILPVFLIVDPLICIVIVVFLSKVLSRR